MINVNVLYPAQAGAKFDFDYYMNTHIPLVRKLLGSALKGCVVEQGVAGGAPGAEATYQVMCHLKFDSVEAFQQAFGPHAETISNDIANYTSVTPVIQISEIRLA